MHLLKTAAQEAVFWSLRSVPQFAYGAGTSAGDAILRVSEDGCKVRRTLESTNTSNLAKLMGDHQPDLKGGLMVAIDLSKAFDNVKHEEIYLSFKESGLSEELSRLITHVHLRTVCKIVHSDYSGSVPMSKGLRQGCPIAP